MSIALEILEWSDAAADEMVHRLPAEGSADIKMGAQLIVQQSQAALFFRDGKCLDVLGPGRHVLSTLNLPILTNLLMLPYGFRSPFRAAVYFVNQKIFTQLRWGTKNPVVFRDTELGVVRLRGYGVFTLRVEQPEIFLNTVVGARGSYFVSELEDFLRDLIVARLNDFLGERLRSVYDLAASYDEIAAAIKLKIRDDFRRYGLELSDFFVNAITPPEDVQTMIDQRSGISAVGDLDRFVKFEAGRALGGNGGNGGGAGNGSALETGVGAALGLALVPNLLRATQGNVGEPAGSRDPQSATPSLSCAKCGATSPPRAKFCVECGLRVSVPTTTTCSRCSQELPTGARFCFECGEAQSTAEGAGS
ncbi:MAG: SPFH domain-containing protein [Candidatus Eisenbacteria bacterium]